MLVWQAGVGGTGVDVWEEQRQGQAEQRGDRKKKAGEESL